MTDGVRWCRYCEKNKPIGGFLEQTSRKSGKVWLGHRCNDCRHKSQAGVGSTKKSRADVCPRCGVFRQGWAYQNVYPIGAEHVCMSCVDTERRNEALEAIPEHERLSEPYRAVFANGVAMTPALVTVVGQRGHLLHAMFDKTLKTGKMTKEYTALVNPDAIFSAADGVDVEGIAEVLRERVEKMIGKS